MLKADLYLELKPFDITISLREAYAYHNEMAHGH
jgi:hypothetical protein